VTTCSIVYESLSKGKGLSRLSHPNISATMNRSTTHNGKWVVSLPVDGVRYLGASQALWLLGARRPGSPSPGGVEQVFAEPAIDDASCAVCGTHLRAICSSCVSAGLQGKIGFGLGVDYPPERSIEKCFYCRRREAEWCWQCYSCASANSYGLAHYADHDLQNGYDARYYVVLTSIEGSKFQTQIGPIGSSIDPLVRACRPPDHFNTSERATSTPAGTLSV
jgi:hypothetical protein